MPRALEVHPVYDMSHWVYVLKMLVNWAASNEDIQLESCISNETPCQSLMLL